MENIYQKMLKYNPGTKIEIEIWQWAKEWYSWWIAYDKASDKKLGKNPTREAIRAFEKEYFANKPRPKEPDLIRLDFSGTLGGSTIIRRLTERYYDKPKVVLVKDECNTAVWMVNEQTDFATVGKEIFESIRGSLQYFDDEIDEPKKPQVTSDEDMAKIKCSPETRQRLKEMEQDDAKHYSIRLEAYNKWKKNKEVFEKAKQGDKHAIASVLRKLIGGSTRDHGISIEVLVPKNKKLS